MLYSGDAEVIRICLLVFKMIFTISYINAVVDTYAVVHGYIRQIDSADMHISHI